jgi:hypothetical protein
MVQAQSAESTPVDEFRTAHKIWKEANDSFHDRFQDIVTRGKAHDLDALAKDLSGKFDYFMRCSKVLVDRKRQ